MDLYELRLDQPHPGTRDGAPGHGRVCQLPHPPRARAGRAPGAVAGTASRDESSMSDRARAQVTTPEALPDERLTDAALRPSRLDEFVGQAKVKESLQIAIDAAKQRREPLDHTLFFGPPGLGKTTRSEAGGRSEEHTSELQSPCNLVCRLLLEKKKIKTNCDKCT